MNELIKKLYINYLAMIDRNNGKRAFRQLLTAKEAREIADFLGEYEIRNDIEGEKSTNILTIL